VQVVEDTVWLEAIREAVVPEVGGNNEVAGIFCVQH
jgi:hypothetical protein